jgi:CRISPR-associated exonuclease Cas4
MDYPTNHVNLSQIVRLEILLPYLSILFLLFSLVLFIIAARQKRQVGIPPGRVIYTDTSSWGKVEKPLYNPELRLTGKPDYLVEHGNEVIPVEVKSRSSPQAPFDSHIYQLGAYCLLVEHEFGIRPKYGIIHYRNRTFAIDFTSALEDELKATILEMQEKTTRSQVNRSHENPHCCQHCGFRSICDQSLRI